MANQCEPPPLVAAEPRYQQETFETWRQIGAPAERVALPVWNLDGVYWSDASWSKIRFWHKHWAQTVAVIDGEVFYRCPCGVTTYV